MALGTVGIQIGAGAFLQRGAEVSQGRKLGKSIDARFVKGGIEQSDPIQCSELVIGHSGGWIGEVAIELAGLDPEHIIGGRRMAGQTIRLARIVPGLGTDAAGIGDEDVLAQTAREQICIAVVGTPFIGDAINGAQIVAHQQPGFEASFDARIGLVGDEFEMFNEDGPGGEAPLASGRESDLFVRRVGQAMVGHSQPAGL